MGRPKKVKPTEETLTTVDVTKQVNTYQDYVSAFVEGFIGKIFSSGIIRDVTPEKLQEYFANPDENQELLENLMQYYYISNGNVFQLYDLAVTLPTLNYKIETLEKDNKYEDNILICNKALKQIKYKQLVRDLISQTISTGTTTGIWLGNNKKPYLFLFDNLKYAFPSHRVQGEWVVKVDMSWFDGMKEAERETYFANLKPHITQRHYDKYLADKQENQYVELPQDRSICVRTHTLKRNQRLGVMWGTQGLYPIVHKKHLQDLEKNIANKIINAIAVLTIGSKENESYANLKLNSALKKKIHAGVKKALEKSESEGISLITIPEFSSISFPDLNTNVLDDKKFNGVNNDITSSLGTSDALLNGTGANFASAKLNLEVMYKKVGLLLESIENEVFTKFFKIILPSTVADDYYITFDKETPLSIDKKLETLTQLGSQGYAIKPIIDMLHGIDYKTYISDSIYEQEVLKLHEKIIPPQTSYTLTQKGGGRPEDTTGENQNTVVGKENDANNLPE